MNDKKTTIAEIKIKFAQFVADREWDQFHTPQNLSMDISVEAAELLEKFLWMKPGDSQTVIEEKRAEIEEEVGDILMALVGFCNLAKIDLSAAFEKKLALTAQRYPVEKSKGNNKKYTEL